MKKMSIVISMAFLAYACGNSNQNSGDQSAAASTSTPQTEAASPAPATASTDLSDNPDYKKGLALIAKNDCLTCHKVDEKLIGPAYRDVANKYTDKDIPMLAAKIIKGGSGVWGQVPMTPHPNLSVADAEQMVKYILLLKK
ncbi:MAG: c-type cytochrome [Hydrotalea flava]|uniref:c-type cytochrome n=1 Tax=Hydrotalea TaxID=1004300 RepID=UPI000944DBD9|nr:MULTISPECIES: c-type cytochrome [Hydrotalea]NIM34929.1 c-type cytochrome [Hydrotalea flava]NIM38520.1 c-type cytochrome [Hydrotalea flava]NIN02924.1 c-type cytochrome [Hydrotalea flava]NIN14609.1 c-type cytochrome [Hydrotalea flava]NIO94446.1 c-type cytochrome [Hydrotalea flava]